MRLALSALFLVLATPAAAQGLTLPDASDGAFTAGLVQTFGLVSVLAVAPGILVVVTSFTRLAIALSILRFGLGLQTTPANLILISLALFMTFHIMAPTMDRAWTDGLKPLGDGKIEIEEAVPRILAPFEAFMRRHVRAEDLTLFAELSAEGGEAEEGATNGAVRFTTLAPAFMISEIRRGFEIGFLILIPFLAIDLIVATITMSMGMMMLPPTVVSLPFKVLFFVLVDGWNLLTGSLLRSFL